MLYRLHSWIIEFWKHINKCQCCDVDSPWAMRINRCSPTVALRVSGYAVMFLVFMPGWTRPQDLGMSQDTGETSPAELSNLRGPYFDTSASKNVTALVGKTAYLNCRVRNLGNRTVSWVRHRDIHLLTVARYTYTSDQRFQSIHSPQTEDWTLQIRYPQRRDSGVYECQVSTTPPIGTSMYLSVVEPITTIVGGPDLYINKGSTLNLTCVVKHSPEPPPAIYWTHNSEEINYDSPRGGVSVITEKGDVTTSYLLIQRATQADSGKYTCSPSNANSKTVVVHVLNGEQPAAMQHGGQLRLEYPISVFLLSASVTFLS